MNVSSSDRRICEYREICIATCHVPADTTSMAADLVDVPAVFDAAGPGGSLTEGGAAFSGAGYQWATLGHLVDAGWGVLVWRLRVGGDHMYCGLITGDAPVPAVWTSENARGYEICTASVGWIDVLGQTQSTYEGRPHYRMAPRGSEVECCLDMNARTMSFTVNDSAPPCVAFTNIIGPVRPIVWGGDAKMLRVRASAAATGASDVLHTICASCRVLVAAVSCDAICA